LSDKFEEMALMAATAHTEAEAHGYFARECNQRVWALIAQSERSDDEEVELLDAAHASLFHWRYAGTAVHLQRGEWLISHADALRHAILPMPNSIWPCPMKRGMPLSTRKTLPFILMS
jgi:hypothetical protein